MLKYDMESPVSLIPGVGRVREKSFAALGIYTFGDLLFHFPRAYQNRGDVRLLAQGDFSGADSASYVLTVASEPKISRIRSNMTVIKFRAFDESGSCSVTFFNQDYLKNIFHTGSEFRFFGRLTHDRGGYQLNSPAFEPYAEGIPLPEFIPVYPLSAGITQKYISMAVQTAMKSLLNVIPEHLPGEIRDRFGLCSVRYALKNIHNPCDYTALDAAVKRLSFDELFIFALALCSSKSGNHVKNAPVMSDISIKPFLSRLNYRLTGAQSRAVSDIINDMSGHGGADSENGRILPMSRIIVGDVGCGKTVCAAAAAYIAAKNGCQTAIMAPTEILASQHYRELSPLFAELGIRCELLTGSMTKKQKESVYNEIMFGGSGKKRIDILIGTHALIEDTVQFKKLGLVVTDEQHRFGVMQRAALEGKSEGTHVLVMSATPIPRTLSLIMYGDLEVSLIDEMPPGRKRVDTFVVDERYRERLNGFIRRQVSENHQVYIVCPSVEESAPREKNEPVTENAMTVSEIRKSENRADNDFSQLKIENPVNHPPLKSAVKYAAELSRIFPDLRVGFVHGRMKSGEKESVMNEFCHGRIDILVSTTVIEVGVNVPNATLMIVENAERFGLSQLHQLRGRVGRGEAKSYCVLVSDSRNEISRERLNVMRTTFDGYTIAEKDLAIRGPGDLFDSGFGEGIRQHGAIRFRLAGADTDSEILDGAFTCARELASNDPELAGYPLLKAKIEALHVNNNRRSD